MEELVQCMLVLDLGQTSCPPQVKEVWIRQKKLLWNLLFRFVKKNCLHCNCKFMHINSFFSVHIRFHVGTWWSRQWCDTLAFVAFRPLSCEEKPEQHSCRQFSRNSKFCEALLMICKRCDRVQVQSTHLRCVNITYLQVTCFFPVWHQIKKIITLMHKTQLLEIKLELECNARKLLNT